MFGFLKKKLSESVEKLSDKVLSKEEEKPKEEVKKAEVPKERPGPAKKAKRKVPKPRPRIPEPERPGPVPEPEPGPPPEPSPPEPEPEERRVEKVIEKPAKEKHERKGFLSRLRGKAEPEVREVAKEDTGIRERLAGKVLERKVSGKDIDSLFEEMELGLLEANVSLETVDFLKERMKGYLVGRQLKRGKIEQEIRDTLEIILVEMFGQGKVDLERLAKEKKPVSVVFLGFNGSGKTTSISKLGKYLTDRGFKVVLAAGDTWRSAAIEQLEVHGNKLGLKVIKHKYGSDSAAVIYDAIEHAKSKGIDFVLADTAGRSHSNQNLMDELKKVIKVNKPDLKILVMDSLTGNDLVDQARNFDEAVGIDAMIFTKVDVNEKGGGMLSACHVVKKPILYIGLGQDYGDIEIFDPRKFVKDLMGD